MDDALARAKQAARTAALARRGAAHAADDGSGAARLSALLRAHRGVPLAGYLPIRSEIDPRPAMAEAARHGPVAVPVIDAPAAPLRFARWAPDTALAPGPFGVTVPVDPQWIVPEILIVPLLAFTAQGARLGYGGGFYDRTLQALRARGPVLAVGFAYGAQQADTLPFDPNDQPLDLLVTDREILSFS